ncbi:hypothetical protein M422DRAFT_44169 [Sphaerobolus stellatus SS14]|nr:hypothetical protein M422DRAFT_44169 [Sphaerobolus stellatus SS14]
MAPRAMYPRNNPSQSGITTTKSTISLNKGTSRAASGVEATGATVAKSPENISSPHELTAFVENILVQLESKFDDMSAQVLDRMDQLSSRITTLEESLKDLLSSDFSNANSMPGSPASGNLNFRSSGL